jgi:uncharacterized membrane protein
MKISFRILAAVIICAASLDFFACGGGGGSTAPIKVIHNPDGKISFSKTVQPILQDHCRRCHDDKRKGGLYLMTFDGVMKGGNRGSIVIPGDPKKSLIRSSGEKTKPPHMPPRVFPALTEDRIQSIRTWIAEGATNH